MLKIGKVYKRVIEDRFGKKDYGFFPFGKSVGMFLGVTPSGWSFFATNVDRGQTCIINEEPIEDNFEEVKFEQEKTMKSELPTIRFTVKDNYGRVSTVDYEWNKDDGIPDQETILENMEECSCSLNESVNTCECEPEWDNGEILKVEYLNANSELAPTLNEEDIVDILNKKFNITKPSVADLPGHSLLYNEMLMCFKDYAKALVGKLPKQPCYREDELLKMMPPDKDESKSRNPVDVTFEVAYNHARKEIARALANRLQKPRKVDGKKIKQLIDDCVSVGNRTELFLSIMKEIGDE